MKTPVANRLFGVLVGGVTAGYAAAVTNWWFFGIGIVGAWYCGHLLIDLVYNNRRLDYGFQPASSFTFSKVEPQQGMMQTLPVCAKCGGIYVSHPRLGISHLCGVAGHPETKS